MKLRFCKVTTYVINVFFFSSGAGLLMILSDVLENILGPIILSSILHISYWCWPWLGKKNVGPAQAWVNTFIFGPDGGKFFFLKFVFMARPGWPSTKTFFSCAGSKVWSIGSGRLEPKTIRSQCPTISHLNYFFDNCINKKK